MGLMGKHEGGRSTKISFSVYCVRPQRDRPLLPSKYSWPITICARLACSYTILPQIRVAKLSPPPAIGTQIQYTTPQTALAHHIALGATVAASALTFQWLKICQSLLVLRRWPWSRLQVRREDPWTERLPKLQTDVTQNNAHRRHAYVDRKCPRLIFVLLLSLTGPHTPLQ